MTEHPTDPEPAPRMGIIRRIAAGLIIGTLVFGLLWYTVFNAVTAALVASGGTVVLLAGASVSDVFESIFETVANIVLGILGAIVDFFSSIFD